MDNLYEINEIALTLCDGIIMPILITKVMISQWGYVYEYNYEEYKKMVINSFMSNFDVTKLTLFKKDQVFIESDLYKTLDDYLATLEDIKEVISLINTVEGEFK